MKDVAYKLPNPKPVNTVMYYSPGKSRDWLLQPCIAAAQPAVENIQG